MTGPWRDGASGGTPITAAELNDIQAEVDKVGPIGESVDALADLVNTGRLSDEALAGSYAPKPEGTPTGAKFLRDDNTWAAPPAGGGGGGSFTEDPARPGIYLMGA